MSSSVRIDTPEVLASLVEFVVGAETIVDTPGWRYPCRTLAHRTIVAPRRSGKSSLVAKLSNALTELGIGHAVVAHDRECAANLRALGCDNMDVNYQATYVHELPIVILDEPWRMERWFVGHLKDYSRVVIMIGTERDGQGRI